MTKNSQENVNNLLLQIRFNKTKILLFEFCLVLLKIYIIKIKNEIIQYFQEIL